MDSRLRGNDSLGSRNDGFCLTKAATVLGISRPRVSDVIRHKNSNFTVDELINMVVRTGQRVQISV